MKTRVMVLLAVVALAGCSSTHMIPSLVDPNDPKIKVYKKLGKIKSYPDVPVVNRRDGSRKPVVVKWFTKRSTDTVDITFVDSGCVDMSTKRCSGNKCEIDTDTATEGDKVCKYNIILNGELEDPILVIDDNG